LGRRGICVNCISFYCHWQLLSVLPGQAPGPEVVAGDMAVAAVSMAVGAAAFMVAMAVEVFTVVLVVTAVIEAGTVAGDTDADGAAGVMDGASG